MLIFTSSICPAVNGAAGVFSHSGLISSIVSPSALAPNRRSASCRSPQQIGLNPAHDFPLERNIRNNCTTVWVFPTPVSVPVTKKLTMWILCRADVGCFNRLHHRLKNLCAIGAAESRITSSIRVWH